MRKSVARSKTRKSVTKRFKITGTGKILRRKQGRRHLAECKNRKRKRNLRKVGLVAEVDVPRVLAAMPFGQP
jgi:large subunit ribosomal protein L35